VRARLGAARADRLGAELEALCAALAPGGVSTPG
jgi:hypothetical protein